LYTKIKMGKREYRNNGRHGKFGKDVETVVVSRRVPKQYAEKISAMFDEILFMTKIKMAISETIQFIWDQWPLSYAFYADSDSPDPMFDVCMLLPDLKDKILFLSVGNLTGITIQPLLLKNGSDLSSFKKLWSNRVELRDIGDKVFYGPQYRIDKGTFCIPPDSHEFPLENFKQEIDTWYRGEHHAAHINPSNVDIS
jgi:hypothetical protein